MNKKQEYIQRCEKEARAFLETHPHVIKFVKNEHGQRVGVILFALLENENKDPMLFYGWSKCHTQLEPFNKWIGVVKAIARLEDPEAYIPENIYNKYFRKEFDIIVGRAKRYFKQISWE